MRDALLWFSVLLAFAGMLSFVTGITGSVIGQSCCAGPECPVENICDYALGQPDPSPADFYFMGSLFVLIGGMLYFRTRHHHEHPH